LATNSAGKTTSSDGHTVATASDGTTIRLWETDPERGRGENPREQAKWQLYLPDVPFRAL
jgi:hypothetical protein